MVRKVFISGGAKGIGAGLVREFAHKGYTVAFCYKTSKAQAAALIAELKKEGFLSVYAYECDVSDFAAVQRLKSELNKEVGFIDTVVCNAAVSTYGLFCDTTPEEYNLIMDNNFKSVYNVSRIFAPSMVSEGFGRIISISSIFGQIGGSMEVLYSASKAAIIGLTKALSKELALSGITVNAIAPGLIDTDMNSRLSENDKQELISEIPVGRIGAPQDVALTAVFLAEEKSSFITGQVIAVNGGEI